MHDYFDLPPSLRSSTDIWISKWPAYLNIDICMTGSNTKFSSKFPTLQVPAPTTIHYFLDGDAKGAPKSLKKTFLSKGPPLGSVREVLILEHKGSWE